MPSTFSFSGPKYSQGKPYEYQERSRNWTNTANYSTVPKDLLPVNSYTDSMRKPSQVFGTEIRFTKPNGPTITNTICYSTLAAMLARHDELSAFTAVVERSDSAMENEVKLATYLKVADAKTNLGVALAEAHKTSDLILSSARRIDRAYRSFRRGDFRRVAQELNISPNRVHKNWLEYKYGWMPVLMDVKNGAEFFAQQHMGRSPRFVAQTKVSSSVKRVVKTIDESYSLGSYYVETGLAEKVYRCKIWCELTNPHLSAIQQLGLTNPALVAWELIPYSFVFDWFISVGDWLTALTAFHGVTVRRAMISRIRQLHVEYYSHAHRWDNTQGSSSGYDFTFRSDGRSYTRYSFVVNPLDVFPRVRFPDFGFNRTTTSLALIRSRYH